MSNACCGNEKTTADLNRRLTVNQMMTEQDKLNEFISSGWSAVLLKEHFKTAIISEFGEFINDHGVSFKWWGSGTDPALYNEHDVKIEIIDVVHFYLSLMIINFRNSIDGRQCSTEVEFDQFDDYYVGTDKGNHFTNGLIRSPNLLNHKSFVELVCDVTCSMDKDIFEMIDVLDSLSSSMAMTSEEFSAYLTAKNELNYLRNTVNTEEYQKINEAGVEDNDRLYPLITAFLSDTAMTLTTLRENVFAEFYEQVV